MDIREFQERMRIRSKELFPQCKEWTPADWVVAFIGEVGEAANVQKKIKRDGPVATSQQRDNLTLEFGDAFSYLCLWAGSCGVDLESAGIAANNKVAIREGRLEFVIEE